MDGPIIPVEATSTSQISQQLISQQYTSQTTTGARLNYPLPTWAGIQSSLNVGLDYKSDKVVTLKTNYFYESVTVINGTVTNNKPLPTTAIPLGVTYPELHYTPLFLGWTGSRQDHWLQMGAPADLWSRFDGSFSIVAGTGGNPFQKQGLSDFDRKFPGGHDGIHGGAARIVAHPDPSRRF